MIVNTEPGLPQPTEIRVIYEGNGEFEDREVFGASDAVIVRRKVPEIAAESLGQCAIMIVDPGTSPAGCSINQSSYDSRVIDEEEPAPSTPSLDM